MLELLAIVLSGGVEMIKVLEDAPKVRRLIWGVLAVACLFALSPVLVAWIGR